VKLRYGANQVSENYVYDDKLCFFSFILIDFNLRTKMCLDTSMLESINMNGGSSKNQASFSTNHRVGPGIRSGPFKPSCPINAILLQLNPSK
jgi:hypothetical protein